MGSTTDPALTPPKAPPPSITEVNQYNDGIPSTEFTVRINTSILGVLGEIGGGKLWHNPHVRMYQNFFCVMVPVLKRLIFVIYEMARV